MRSAAWYEKRKINGRELQKTGIEIIGRDARILSNQEG